MGTVARGTKTGTGTTAFGPSTVAKSSEVNTDFNTIYAVVNGGLDNDNIAAGAAIVDTKLAQITTALKVHGSSLTGLASVPAGAGVVPAANLTSVAQKGANSDITSLSGLTTALSIAQGGTSQTTAALAINALLPSQTSASGLYLKSDGSVCSWAVAKTTELFTSSGTFTAPVGVTKVFVSMVGSGGAGGRSTATGGGGGGSGAYIIRAAVDVVAESGYTVTIGNAGAGGMGNGGDGGAVSFAAANVTLSCNGGSGGIAGDTATAGAGGAGSGAYNASGTTGGSFVALVGGNGANGSTNGGGGGGNPFGKGGNGGAAGTGFGSGGGGGNPTNSAGLDGAKGMVYIEW